MAITDNLTVGYKFDEASGNALDVLLSNDLTDTNTVTATTGKVSGARLFTKANAEYFTHADNAAFSTGDIDFTWAVWINAVTPSNTAVLFSKSDATVTEYELYISGTKVRFYVENGGASADVGATTFGNLTGSTSYFVVAWHDSVNNIVGVSVNDVSDTTSYSSGVLDNAHPFYVARNGANFAGQYFDGWMDELFFWKRVLTSGERTQLYNAGAGLAYPWTTSTVKTLAALGVG